MPRHGVVGFDPVVKRTKIKVQFSTTVFRDRLTSLRKVPFREFYLTQGLTVVVVVVVVVEKVVTREWAGVTKRVSSSNRLSFSDHHLYNMLARNWI